MTTQNTQTKPELLFDEGLEKALIGALLLPDAGWVTTISASLRPEAFYSSRNQEVYAAILAVGEGADNVSVAEELRRRGVKDVDESYLAQCMIETPTALNAPHYAARIQDYALRRQLHYALSDIAAMTFNLNTGGDILALAHERLNRLESMRQANATQDVARTVGSELYSREYPPREFLVDGLIARGNCVVIAARPKSGKSWFCLQLAQAVDTGAPFLGRATKKARVLLCALEDGERRIHERMHIRKWNPRAAELIFGMMPFDSGGAGIDQLTGAAADFDLIIVDTLISTLTAATDESDNTGMAEILNRLARYAHTTDKALLIVHHTGKGATDDPFDAIRGASAIRGAYDVGIILQRKQNEREAVIKMESRDLENEDMTIQFDKHTGWTYAGDGKAYEGMQAGRRAMQALEVLGDGQTTERLAAYMGVSVNAVRQSLQRAESNKQVHRMPEELSPTGKKHKRKDVWYLGEKP